MSLLLIMLVVAGQATDPTLALPSAPPHSGAVWLTPPRPQFSDFPGQAMSLGISGGAAIRCTVVASGIPDSCEILQERPEGHRFGRAALRIVERGRLDPSRIRESDIGTTFVVTVPFNLNIQ